jgi:hypothetical protein
MEIKKEDHKKIMLGIGALALILMVVFVFGKMKGRDENEERAIDVQVNIKDENGETVSYDPNPLLVRLNKGLITRYYFDFSERCDPIKELYSLDSVRFMATVRAYKVKYNIDIQTHMKACNVDCNINTGINALSHFDLIYKRIDNLKDIIK